MGANVTNRLHLAGLCVTALALLFGLMTGATTHADDGDPGDGARAQSTVDLASSKDNTLVESSSGSKSNGAGTSLFVGRVGNNTPQRLRRGVIAFDVTGSVPTGATIDDVSLTLRVTKLNNSNARTVSIHKLLADWGEGSSNSSVAKGKGATATAGDATWLHTFSSGSTWTSAGGDYTSAPSSSQSVGGTTSYVWSSAQMVADVQSWLDSPSSNFGWIVIGDEATNKSIKWFGSRENGTASNRPKLSVTYTPQAAPTPTFQFSVDTTSVDEDSSTLVATVDLIDASSTVSTADLTTADGSAIGGSDFTPISQTVTLGGVGATSTQIVVTVLNDAADPVREGVEEFSVKLSNPSSGSVIEGDAGSGVSFTITIDDQQDVPTFTVADLTTPEANSTSSAPVAVALVGKSVYSTTVEFLAVDTTTTPVAEAGKDYQSVSTTLVFPPNTTTASTTQAVQVVIVGDDVDEFDEVFEARLSNASEPVTGLVPTITDGVALVTIADADPAPKLAILDKTANETDATTTLTVSLTGSSSGGVSVDVTPSGGTATAGADYTLHTTTLTWAAEESGSKTVTVTLLDDSNIEGAELAIIALFGETTTGPSAEGVVVEDGSGSLKIIDDEAPLAIPSLTWWGLVAAAFLFAATLVRRGLIP